MGCGVTDMRVLQINHVDGGGGGRRRPTPSVWLQSILDGTCADELDVRCANCNHIYEFEAGRRRIPFDPDLTVEVEPATMVQRESA